MMWTFVLTGGGLLKKLHDDVETCGYEDVKVMWEMLRRSESELLGQPKRKQRLFWRVSVWSNHAAAPSCYSATHASWAHQINNSTLTSAQLSLTANAPTAQKSLPNLFKEMWSLCTRSSSLPLWAEKHPLVSINKFFWFVAKNRLWINDAGLDASPWKWIENQS